MAGIAIGTLICAFGYGLFILGYLHLASGRWQKQPWADELTTAAYVIMTAALAYPCYSILTRGMTGARSLFPIALIYLIAAYMAPVLKLWQTMELGNTQHFAANFDVTVAMLITAPIVTSLLVAAMLSIAPSDALRQRMLASIACTVALFGINEVMKHVSL